MESIDKRKPRSFTMSDKEYSFAEYLMSIYGYRSVSEVIRFLVIRDTMQQLQGTAESAGSDDSL